MCKNLQERDELRARFTVWLDKIMLREANRYRKAKKSTEKIISLDNVPEESLPMEEKIECHPQGFDFEEERLAEAFAKLSPKRQQVLTMMFVEEKKSGEIAKLLGATPESVYLLRHRSIKELRESRMKGGDEN